MGPKAKSKRQLVPIRGNIEPALSREIKILAIDENATIAETIEELLRRGLGKPSRRLGQSMPRAQDDQPAGPSPGGV